MSATSSNVTVPLMPNAKARPVSAQSGSWQQRFSEWQADGEAQQWMTSRCSERARNRPAVRDWIGRLVSGESRFRELQLEFDRRTRREWACFGLGGQSGAMVFNKWAKHHPDPIRVQAILQETVPLPASDALASSTLRRLHSFAVESLDLHGLQQTQLEPKRAVRFLTCLWGLQANDDYPCMYSSAIRALIATGLLSADQHPVDQFESFRSVYYRLAAELATTKAELGFFLRWLAEKTVKESAEAVFPKPSLPPPPPAVEVTPRSRSWLIAPGPGAKFWKEWQKRGEAAIGW